MTAKPKKSARGATASSTGKSPAPVASTSPLTLEEHVHRIEAMGKRIESYVQFMCQLANQTGMSSEVKERGVLTFYKQMLVVEAQLGRIHDELRLE